MFIVTLIISGIVAVIVGRFVLNTENNMINKQASLM
ncbi:Protein of unknown function [Bacillus cytotoxicus]|uniref:Uncharacterized protein n=1 Tax=Bacillus cytotoxicus TaxID=580165 RepID=A0AAX2CL23_9BACI|nr:Protein of unknown function [Bacillus cytotoxicus]